MILTPTKVTLAKYGLSEAEWLRMMELQRGVCLVCHQEPKSGRLCVDHEHVKRWRHLPPDVRKRSVRGGLCWRCNTTFVGRGISIERAENVAKYLRDHDARRGASAFWLSEPSSSPPATSAGPTEEATT